MRCLHADHFLWRHNVNTLQALILLMYGINHTHGHTWSLLGLTYNIAVAIGCHIDPSNFDLNLVECEERRRCWAGLMMLYTVQNTALGSLDLQRIKHEVALPLNADDCDVAASNTSTSAKKLTQMSYLLFKFRLYDLSSRVCNHVFGSSHPTYQGVLTLDADIISEQNTWNAKYLSDVIDGRTLPVHHIVHLNILYGYSHQLSLLLHRPIVARGEPFYRSDEVSRSRARCTESAMSLLDIQKLLSDSAEFAPFGWYVRGLGSFHAFHAAVFLVAEIISGKEPQRYEEIMDAAEKGLATFESMVDQSDICRRAAQVIRHLL